MWPATEEEEEEEEEEEDEETMEAGRLAAERERQIKLIRFRWSKTWKRVRLEPADSLASSIAACTSFGPQQHATCFTSDCEK